MAFLIEGKIFWKYYGISSILVLKVERPGEILNDAIGLISILGINVESLQIHEYTFTLVEEEPASKTDP